jgi:hypothetical protein
LTEAGKAPASQRVYETLDTSDWFDSKLPPAREQPEAQLRASDSDEETVRAHQGMSDFDSPPAPSNEPAEPPAPPRLPPAPPAPPYPTNPGFPPQPPQGGPYGGPQYPPPGYPPNR